MKLSIGFSPCPNDTFIFDALVNKKIPSAGIEWEPVLEDVETLNQWAAAGKLDISKISYAALPQALEHYVVLNAGSALGIGVGPLLVSKFPYSITRVESLRIAIPGEHTTANLLFSMAFPQAKNKKYMLFSEIEDAILNGEADAGVIIHENRFTYQAKGLKMLMDLGNFWEKATRSPLPLGGIVIRRSFSYPMQQRVNQLIRQSIEIAFSEYPAISDYIRGHSQSMDESVMRKHIELYVNDYSLDLGEKGEKAVWKLIETYSEVKGMNYPSREIFVTP
jgi:1,4-dihydroxy-6-naphthoate synthase